MTILIAFALGYVLASKRASKRIAAVRRDGQDRYRWLLGVHSGWAR